MANISISLKKYKADYSRFLHNAKVLRLTFQTPAQRNDNPIWACAENSSPKKLLPAAYCRHRVLYLKVPIVFLRPPWTKVLSMRHPSRKTLLARLRAHSVFQPWDCLGFVALCWPILARSDTAWFIPKLNIHHWKGNLVTFNRIS